LLPTDLSLLILAFPLCLISRYQLLKLLLGISPSFNNYFSTPLREAHVADIVKLVVFFSPSLLYFLAFWGSKHKGNNKLSNFKKVLPKPAHQEQLAAVKWG